jgi:hypothetical protein
MDPGSGSIRQRHGSADLDPDPQMSLIRNTIGTSTFPVSTQLAAKLSKLSFIAEKALPVPRDFDLSTHLASMIFLLLFIAEKGTLYLGLGTAHPAGSQAFLISVYCRKGTRCLGPGPVHTAGSQASYDRLQRWAASSP